MLSNKAKEQSGVVDNQGSVEASSSEVSPAETNSAVDRQEVTAFVDDNAVLVEEAPGEVALTQMGSQQHTDSRIHSIISYLQRPQLVKTFEFAPGQKRNTILTGGPMRVPDILFNPMIRNKLDGFTSFRATAVFQLQLNAQPFQAGRLIMFAVPMPTLIQQREKWITKHVTLAQSLHNVQIDINKQTEVYLRVPFVSPYNSYDLIHGEYPWASVYVMVYSELNQVQQPALQCLVYAHFEDIELGAPTSGLMSATALEQAGRVPEAKGAPKEITATVANALRSKESTGVISTISSGAQKGYSLISKKLPVLAPITDLLSTLSGVASSFLGGVASGIPIFGKLLGLSKPLLSHSGETVVVRPTQYFGNVDGIDHSHMLALDALNTVDEYPTLGGTDKSETSLEFIQSIPQYIANFCYGKDSKYNTQLLQLNVTPNALVPADVQFKSVTGYTVPKPTKQPTILGYTISPFQYWTGSLVYTFRFIKTNFHSGRVEISYHPFVVQNAVQGDRSDYVYRLVVDLRDNSEVSVTIPYISATPWKRTAGVFAVQDTTSWSDSGSNMTGVLRVRALTPLICASEIVSNTVEVLVELRAGPDFEVAAPVRRGYIPFTFFSTQSAQEQAGEVYALPGTLETRTTAIEGKVPESITGIASDMMRTSTSQWTMGEKISDLRAFTRRFAFVEAPSALRNNVLARNCNYLIRPGVLAGQKWSGTAGKFVQVALNTAPCPLTFVSGMYAFYRGSYRLKVYITEAKSPVDLVSLRLASSSSINYVLNPSSAGVLGYTAIGYEQNEQKRFAEFQVPYYSPTVCTVPYPLQSVQLIGTQPDISVLISVNTVTKDGSPLPPKEDETVYYKLALAGGDDMSFHMFLGTPPCFDSGFVAGTVGDEGTSIGNVNLSNFIVDPCYFANEPGDKPSFKLDGTIILNSDSFEFSDISNANCKDFPPPPPGVEQ